MTEWGVVGVLISLVGLAAAIVGPITKLTQSITRLTVVVERLEKEQQNQKTAARESHKKLWEKCGELDDALARQAQRITLLEQRHMMKREAAYEGET